MIGALLVPTLLAATSPRYGELAQAFWSRDLGAARLAYAHAVAETSVDPAFGGPAHFWQELFDLADCVPLKREQTLQFAPRNEWEVLTALARIERMRLRRARDTVGPAADLAKLTFFARATREAPEGVVSWPDDVELWSDETFVVEVRETQCGALPPVIEGEGAQRALDEELAQVRALVAAVPAEHPAWPALQLHQAALLVRQGKLPEALEAAQPLFAAVERLPPAEADQSRLLAAIDHERQGRHAEALAIYRVLATSPHLPRVQPFIQSRVQAGLLREGRTEELLAVLPTQPDVKTPVGRYQAWLRGRALLQLSRYDLLLDHARASLRSAPGAVQRDPALGALADLVYGYLATVEFDDRVVEIVESVGAPRELYPRLERFAQIALAQGRFESARAALQWLLAHHRAGQHHPRYQARLAEVAFEVREMSSFLEQLRALTTPQEKFLQIIPPERRGAFWEERDTQLLQLTRTLVPKLAERADDRWTEPLVQILQTFLRDAPQTKVLTPLTELYRTTRALVGTGARRYSEKVGSERPPLVLGEVEVLRPMPEPPAPQVPPVIDEPRFLLRIPVGAEPQPVRGWFAEVAP